MAHPLGELVLLVPERDAAEPARVAELEAHLRARDVASRRVPLGRDERATAEREIAGGARLLVHCGGQASMVRWLPAVVGTETVAGAFPGGAANDLARTFGLDVNPEAAAILLESPRFLRVDVGVARLGEREIHVFNHAVVGLGAGIGGRGLGSLLRWYAALARARTTRFDVDMTFAEYHDTATQVRLANGQYALGGLHAAPTALPDDGAWDVQVWGGPRTLPFTLQPAMRRGEHLPNEHVTQWRQKRADVAATPPAPVAVDDVVVGRTPVSFELLPKALRLKI
ncbi:MAG TPA: diacylglycerol kinase family protein [Mycobacteriales bacterium]|jgi:diacylglycerol kinase family enzyme|nr:diacylglycerol kinase family protein [Mycobacteriales bacterium]